MKKSFEAQGYCDDQFLPVQHAFERNFSDGLEWGASVAVTHHGKPVVDLWGGSFDRHGRTPWQRDTVANVASTTKVAAMLSGLMAVQRGLIELDAPIADYWPEFAQGGKENALVRHAFYHSTGAPGLKQPVTSRVLNNFVETAEHIAREPAWFAPGASTCYHALTYGVIIGEMIRRTDGRGPHQFFEEEIAIPTGADFSIGVKSSTPFERIATVIMEDEDPFEEDSPAYQVLNSFSIDPLPLCWDVLSRENSSFCGYGNARSVARFASILACDGKLEGRRYLSPTLIDEATTEQFIGEDMAIGPICYGLGFGLHSEEFPAPTPSCFHWGGKGGSWVVMDRSSGICAAYVMNRGLLPFDEHMVLDPRQQTLWESLTPLMTQLTA